MPVQIRDGEFVIRLDTEDGRAHALAVVQALLTWGGPGLDERQEEALCQMKEVIQGAVPLSDVALESLNGA